METMAQGRQMTCCSDQKQNLKLPIGEHSFPDSVHSYCVPVTRLPNNPEWRTRREGVMLFYYSVRCHGAQARHMGRAFLTFICELNLDVRCQAMVGSGEISVKVYLTQYKSEDDTKIVISQ